ncbi:hypothetical protein ACFORH_17000 [Amycolatopsis roodepoortensis]|uniref:Knr4/Smi1-like domain-containing protein n=1 Tax=Amycolatopsis roodepoortensis TaxID=700274 RepID=A0ABR9LBV5_9PSEU|nr:hypothetical protein [Amycolatopsis roodepoortensis]MBE1578153.1 hypothetical protein [Amycolatopsis roodepoortensis]
MQISGQPIPIDWDAVQSWLGLTLPADYKALAAHGPLDIGEFVWLHVPCSQPDRFDYGDWLSDTHRSARRSSRDKGIEVPQFHPEPGGLFAWGTTRASQDLFWDTSASSDPDLWPVVVFDRHNHTDPWVYCGMPLADLLDVIVGEGLQLHGGRLLGPLSATARRTAFLADAVAWAPPSPPPPEDLRRRAAVTTGTGLDALVQLVPPPDTPYLGSRTWEELFGELGTPLPSNYVTLMSHYGAGAWGEFLRFYTPLDPAKYPRHATDYLDGYRRRRENFPASYSYTVWPEVGGFLPFAESIDCDVLGWMTAGDPDEWPLAIAPRHAHEGPPLPYGLITTLLEWLRGNYSTEGLAGLDEDDDVLEFAVFEPWTNESYW